MQIKASYMRYRFEKGKDKMTQTEVTANFNDVSAILILSNILSLFQVYNQFIIYLLKLWWLKSKQCIHIDETLITTGYYKLFLTDCLFIAL